MQQPHHVESWFNCLRLILLCEDYEADELLGTDFREALGSILLSQTGHKVQHSLTAQHLVADISTQHDAGLVLQDGSGEAWPDGQPGVG